jgi:hypothetical protein
MLEERAVLPSLLSPAACIDHLTIAVELTEMFT